ncbi:hypothetical protein [Mesorhizobium abyssinicae]|uniref:hypothetical protein n=1 Tax=Mesorhizobium abyssinicae TaxID=1209958 RepID=UPI00339A9742
MHGDNDRDHGAGAPSRKAERSEELPRIPDGPLAAVADHLVSADPRQTARNLGAFKSSGHAARGAFEGSDIGKFDQRNNRLGRAAGDVYSVAVAQGGPGPDAAHTLDQARAVRDIVDFQSPERQSALVDNALSLAPRNQAMVIGELSRNLNKFDRENRDRLIDRAFDLVENGNMASQANAAAALVKAYEHLDEAQKARFARNHLHNTGIPSTSLAGPGDAEPGQVSSLDRRIDGIEASVRQIRETGPVLSRDQLSNVAEVAASISKTHQQARAELLDNRRDRSGRSR